MARDLSLHPVVAAAEDVIAEAVDSAAREAATHAIQEAVSEFMEFRRFDGSAVAAHSMD